MKLDIDYRIHSQPKGIVIYIHDGGWFEGDKNDPRNLHFIEAIYSKGYSVVNANHRLEEFPNPVNDIMNVINYFVKLTDNLIVIGESSGGHLSLLSNLILEKEGKPSAKRIICISTPVDLYSPSLKKDAIEVISKFNQSNCKLACPTYFLKKHNLKLKSTVDFIHSENDFIPIETIKNIVKLLPNSNLYISNSITTNPHSISDEDIIVNISNIL